MFKKYIIDNQDNVFQNIKFEDIIPGRKGANLVNASDNLIPIVRTTTKYSNPNQIFSEEHYCLMDAIRKQTMMDNINPEFNNALVEIYDNQYNKMGYHSDQALDLDPDSYICIYSIYSNPETKFLRKLKIKNKVTNEKINITMENNSIILFSVKCNSEHMHKIILENPSNESKDLWLGFTLRKSKTYIYFLNEIPYFCSNKRKLFLATSEQQTEFYKLRKLENLQVNYIWEELDYTISPSDIKKVTK